MTPSNFLDFIRLVIAGEVAAVRRRLRAEPALATAPAGAGATRHEATAYFFDSIRHYIYAGDTALHMAAAAFSRPMAELLVAHGADVHARNRRGAQPLHYAADGRGQEPQANVIAYLISIGADPNALDKSGVAPLHRAVRKRSTAAVKALLEGGADVRRANKSGSTPLHLAVQTTGASGSGTDEARQEQRAIIKLLLERGARRTDKDGRGKRVDHAATSAWIRDLLSEAEPTH
jgi:hypothetical protein